MGFCATIVESTLLTWYPASRHPAKHLFEHPQTLHVFEGRIRVREVPANVAHGQRSQNGIDDGMGQHVRIRMAEKPFAKRNGHAPEDQGPSFDQSMSIISKTYPEQREHLLNTVALHKLLLGTEWRAVLDGG